MQSSSLRSSTCLGDCGGLEYDDGVYLECFLVFFGCLCLRRGEERRGVGYEGRGSGEGVVEEKGFESRKRSWQVCEARLVWGKGAAGWE